MKIKIDARVFEDMVSVSAQAISAKPMKPEYECVYIETQSDSGIPLMTALAKDAGIAIKKATDHLDVLEEGEALIPAKTLLSFLKLMKGDVELAVDENCKATMKCGSKRVAISCMNTEDASSDFLPMENAYTAEMNGDDFGKCVLNVSHCIGNDQGRLVLTGVNFAFDAESGQCESVGLDGFRMAIAKGNVETNESFTALIPIATAKLIAKIIGGSENVSFRFGNGTVIVEDYTTSIEASLLAGEYMEYKKLAFESSAMRAKVNVSELTEAVKLAAISADSDRKKLIVLNFDTDDTVRVSARADKCESASEIECAVEGGMKDSATEIAFNADYVLEALKAAANYGDEAILMLNTSVSPMAIIPVGRNDYYQLVLPVRRMV